MNDLISEASAAAERRAAPRHKVNLRASVIITAVTMNTQAGESEDAESYFVLQGQLLDVSKTGLALIVSRSDARELKRLGDDIVFRLLLPLPVEAIELEAAPVRYRQMDGTDRILVGAVITNMNGRDRILFMDFTEQFGDSRNP